MGFDKDGKEIDPFEAEIERIMNQAASESKLERASELINKDEELRECLEIKEGVIYTKDSLSKFVIMMTLCKDILGRDVAKALLDTRRYENAEEYAMKVQHIIENNMEEIAINAIGELISTHVAMIKYLKERDGNKED